MEKTYHHGDLKNSLLKEGISLLEEVGEEKLSIRELARRTGVSKSAPYRHFTHKEALLGALSNEGFRLLYTRLESLPQKREEALSQTGRVYFDFAKEHPLLYRLMFSDLMCRLSDEDSQWARKTLQSLNRVLTGEEKPTPLSTEVLLKAWAYFHGLASIYLDGIFPDFFPEPDWSGLFSTAPF